MRAAILFFSNAGTDNSLDLMCGSTSVSVKVTSISFVYLCRLTLRTLAWVAVTWEATARLIATLKLVLLNIRFVIQVMCYVVLESTIMTSGVLAFLELVRPIAARCPVFMLFMIRFRGSVGRSLSDCFLSLKVFPALWGALRRLCGFVGLIQHLFTECSFRLQKSHFFVAAALDSPVRVIFFSLRHFSTSR